MNTTPTNNAVPQEEPNAVVSRGEFMRSLGMSSAALMAFYCMGTLSSCKGSESDPVITPPATGGTTGLTGNATAAGGAINFTMDLTNATYSPLKTVGSFIKVGDVLVINAKGGNYVAVERLCTHLRVDALEYRTANDDILCSGANGGHGSLFNTDGSVKNPPAINALKKYTATLSGNSLVVKA